jgi:hypothetical protein
MTDRASGAVRDHRSRLRRQTLVLFGASALAGVLLALLAGWLWVRLADPPTVPLAANGGLYLGEQALDQQSGVTVWFLVLGVVFGVVAGLLVGWFGRRVGWPAVVAVLLLSAIGALLSRYLGVHVFGPDSHAAASHAAVGTPIQLDVHLDTWVAYLGWPIGGLVGVLAAIAGWSRVETPPQPPPPSPTLYSAS